MSTKTAAAWDLIRAADPMTAIDVTGACEAPAAQDLLRRITTHDPTVLSASGGTWDVLTGPDRGPDWVLAPRRRRLAAGLVAAVVVVVAVAGGTTIWRQRSTPGSPYRQTTAAGYSKALLTQLPLPTGARRARQAPIPELAQRPFTGNGIVDAQVVWWTVPGSLADAVGQFGRTALPAHWKISAGATGFAGPGSNSWVIEVRDPRSRFVSSLTVVMAGHGQTVGVAAQVDTYAIPVRTPAQVIDGSADSATFTFTGGGGQGYSSKITVTVIGPRVTTLVRQINATPTFVLLTTISCPPPGGSAAVTFRAGRHQWSLSVPTGSYLCNTPSLTGTGGTAIDLKPSAALLTAVLAAAGLPSNYFDR